MDALQWQMVAVAGVATLLLIADLALRRRRSRTGATSPSADGFDAMAAARRHLDAAGLPLARQEATAQSRVDMLAEAVEDAAAGRDLVTLADVARQVRTTDRQFAHAERSVDAVIGTKGATDGG
ncbi:hypothetical protein [Streptomonospora litoralis]|uniref:Uncharacterized protein n=1 Tax=Streptomonospora litoralis TaxID=2498135 RepID=A0A4P6PW57_9ACTN|nr:hypothetical protein [Streptomonospora litoralis]QBI51850.1 hypothetical protein EKD16_00115 [Streptomonospora litoralis]